MPIFTKDFTWTETESQVYILLPLKGTNPSKAVILSSSNYLRVTFTPFIFEAFLKSAVDDAKSIAKIIRGTVEFTLFKFVTGLWGALSEINLDKAAVFERRNAAEAEMKAKADEKSKDRADRRYKQREYAVNQQIELETIDKDRIKELKDKENEDISNYLKVYNEEENECEKKCEKKCEKDSSKELQTVVEKQKSCDVSSAVEEKPLQVESKTNEDLYKPNLPPIIFKKKKKRKPKIEFPAPRERCDIPVQFTPRVFPTAARESQAEEERLWLEKQAEARRMNLKPADENYKPEECDPEWLKEKGDSFFNIGNYHAAINAYSAAINQNNKLSYLYSNRAACHLKLGNLHKTIEDSSKALELLDPPVASNAKSRVKAFVRRGTAFCKLKLCKEGLMDYEAALKLDPENADIKSDVEKIKCLKKKS